MAAPASTVAIASAMGSQLWDMQAAEDFWNEVYSQGGGVGLSWHVAAVGN